MEFEVFHKTGEIHFDHNGYDDYDGDEGYETTVDVPEAELLNIMADEYADTMYIRRLEPDAYEVTRKIFKDIVNSFDLFDEMIEAYREVLQEYVQHEYGGND